jgi:CRP-like cAMP-binding protein
MTVVTRPVSQSRLGMLIQNRLLAALAPSDLELLLPHLVVAPMERGAILQEPEARVEQVWFPLSGMISLVAVMQSGAVIETAMVGREGAVGAFAGQGPWHAFTQAVVQMPGVGAGISASRFQDAVRKNEPIRDLVLRYKEFLLAQVQQTAACNALHSLEARLARWLLQTYDRAEDSKLALTQDFLSQMLGVRRTSVTMIAGKLQAAGLIRQHRASVEIVDHKGLEAAACECWATLQLRARNIYPPVMPDDERAVS